VSYQEGFFGASRHDHATGAATREKLQTRLACSALQWKQPCRMMTDVIRQTKSVKRLSRKLIANGNYRKGRSWLLLGMRIAGSARQARDSWRLPSGHFGSQRLLMLSRVSIYILCLANSSLHE